MTGDPVKYVLCEPMHAFGGGWCVPTAIVGLYLHRDGTIGSGGDGPALADDTRYPTREAAQSAADAYAGWNDGPMAGAYRKALAAIVKAWDSGHDDGWADTINDAMDAGRKLLDGKP